MKNKIIKFAVVLVLCSPVILIPLYHMNEEVVMTDYTALDETYSVTLPEGIVQRNMTDSTMEFDGVIGENLFSAVTSVYTKREAEKIGIDCLEEFGDNFEYHNNISIKWEKDIERQRDGMKRSLLKEGTAGVQGFNFSVVMLLEESEKEYYRLFVLGERLFPENMKKRIAFNRLEAADKTGVKDYIAGLEAIPDALQGFNYMQTMHEAEQISKVMRQAGVGGTTEQNHQEALDQMEENACWILKKDWGITDEKSLFYQKENLLTGGQNQEALRLLTEYGIEKHAERKSVVKKIIEDGLDETEMIRILAIYDAKAAFGDNAIRAWDLSRVPTIMGMGYAAGYCTYIEALNASLEAAVLAQQSFDSWKEFNQSYLYGYSFWSEESLETPGSSAYERQQTVETLESEENGPFSVDWNLTLEKEW